MNKIGKSLLVLLVFSMLLCGAGLVLSGLVEREMQGSDTAAKAAVEYTEPDVEQLAYYGLEAFQTTLPILYIDTKGQQITKENTIWATLAVLDAGGNGEERSIMEPPDSQLAITLKYRGASSYSQFDKKQYRMKFYRKKGSTKAVSRAFLGMGSNSEWVLNGPFLDKSLMRNRLIYRTAREIFDWAPDSRYVEVFLDGEYQGLYLAVEPVTNGESRLRLSEFGLLSGECAYVVKRDRVETEADALDVYGKAVGKTSNDLFIDYPAAKDLTRNQRLWIEKDISAFERALYGEDFADAKRGYRAYIDVDNFVDYIILNEVFMIQDAGNLSTYAYKELTGKLQLAVWDFNNALDNYQWFSEAFTDFFTTRTSWLSRLLEDRAFVDQVIVRYRQLRGSVLSDESLMDKMASCQEELGQAVERNFAIWGYSFSTSLLIGEGRDLESYDAAVAQLQTALAKRLAFLDTNIEKLYEYCKTGGNS